jgi:hypothetical protein
MSTYGSTLLKYLILDEFGVLAELYGLKRLIEMVDGGVDAQDQDRLRIAAERTPNDSNGSIYLSSLVSVEFR